MVHELKRLIPEVPLIYFGDTARSPYGTKSKETIQGFALEDTEFLLKKGANIIVIACHSAASTGKDLLKESFNVPIFEVVTPSVTGAIKETRNKRIGVIGTRATIESGIYEREIKERGYGFTVIGRPCPLLVPLVEEGWLKARETRMIVKKYLRPLKIKGIDTLVLGCTHYPMLKGIIQEKIGKRVRIVDPSEEVARQVAVYIKEQFQGNLTTKKVPGHYYFSDLGPVTLEVIKRFIKEPMKVEKVCP